MALGTPLRLRNQANRQVLFSRLPYGCRVQIGVGGFQVFENIQRHEAALLILAANRGASLAIQECRRLIVRAAL